MPKILDYTKQIEQSTEELLRVERKQKRLSSTRAVQAIRLLKSNKAKMHSEVAELIGISHRQVKNYWRAYREGGLEAITDSKPRQTAGRKTLLSEQQEQSFKQRLEQDDIQHLHEACDLAKEEYGQTYSVTGMHYVFKRLKIKKKTARPQHYKQDEEKREDFKKNSRP